MNQEILEKLSVISQEEQAILDGKSTIDRDLYMQGRENTIRSRKLSPGKRIAIRPHTRFIDFPPHRHDYVEVVYMCAGATTHFVNGKKILLQQGELLFLSQSVLHQVSRAEKEDIAVNFIVEPDFFVSTISALGEEETPLRSFLVDCLCQKTPGVGYLHFQVSQIPPIQNLVENLLWTLIREPPLKRKICQMTMALLFLQLTAYTENLSTDSQENSVILKVLRYVESNYRDGSLSDIAAELHYDISWLSREIKRQTGKTYTQIVQEKRLAQAVFLLKNTDIPISDIISAVGYENASFFHRIFTAAYGKSPKRLRDEAGLQERTLF